MSVTISTVNVGTTANDGTGDDVRDAFVKVNNSMANLKIGVDEITLNQANTTLAKVANLQVTNRVIGNVYLYGSDTIYIDGSPVTTAGNAFTGGNVSGAVGFLNSTGATSTTTGAVIVTGGLGVGQNIYAGGIGVFTGNLVAASLTDSSSTTTGAIVTRGGLAVEKSARIGQTLTVTGTTTLSSTLAVTGIASLNATTVSTNTTTGALKVAGGAGIVGNINAGGTQHNLSGNLTVAGNLTVSGNLAFGTETLRISDNIIDLHTNSDLSPLTVDDGKDVGLKFHVYKTGYADYHAFAGWANDSTMFEYYDRGVEIGGVFVGNTYGTFKGGGLLSVNTTAATSTTTGAIRTSGGIGAAGNIYAGGDVVVTANVSAGNVSATKGTFTSVAGTLLTAAQTGITSVGTLTGLTVAGTTALQGTTAGTLNATNGNITTLAVTTGLSTANAVITGGSLNNMSIGGTTHTTGRFTTVTATTVNAGTIGNSGATLTGTLSTAAQTNITSVGTLSSVTVSGTGTLGNIVTTAGVFWANGTAFASSLYSNANVASYLPTYSGNITGNLLGSQPYITGLTGLASLSVTGNVTANIITIGDAGGVFWSNGATALGGSGGGYGNTQVAQYLPGYTGNIGATITDTTQPYITQVGTLTSLAATTAAVTNFSTGNVVISGGYVSALTNVTVTTGSFGTATAATLNATAGNITTLNAGISTVATLNATGGNITTLRATNFSTANAVITGGSLNGATVGATNHTTGRFTTVTATTVNAGTIGNASATFSGASATLTGAIIASTVSAGTIGNSGATLTGTLSTAAQTNITSVGTLSSLTVSGNASVGNLTITGTTTTVNSTVVEVADLNITLAKDAATAVAANGAGITVAGAGATLTYQSTGDKWSFNKDLVVSGATTVNGALVATSVSAGTIGNSGATLTGTLSTAAQTNITSVGTLTSLVVGASGLRVNGTITAATVNASTIGNSGATLTGTLSTAAQTNITSVGTLTGLTVSGAIVPSSNVAINLGSSTAWWNTMYGVSVQAQYADLAENYISDTHYKPGTVVVFGGSAEITLTTEFADVSVAGVISTNPAYLMNADNEGQPVALRGRVPVHVIGPVKKGDLLVTSDSPGYAVSVGKNANYGVAVFAKALQDKDDDDVGTIEAVII
jgi:hypothetical protein